MKQLTAGLIVAAFATTAFGASLHMNFVSSPDVNHPQGGENIGDVIMLMAAEPSDVAWFALWLHLDESETFGEYGYEFNTNPPFVEDFRWDSFQPGPHIFDNNFAGGQLNNWVGTGYYYYYPYYTYPHGPVDVLIALFGIHCTGLIGETDIYYDTNTTRNFFEPDFLTVLEVDTGDAAAGIHVVQDVPEPASLALLALGGMALVRRRLDVSHSARNGVLTTRAGGKAGGGS